MSFDPFGLSSQLASINQQLVVIRQLLRQIMSQEAKMVHSVDEVLADIHDESDQEDKVIALLNGIEQQLKDALGNAGIPADVQAKIDQAFDALEANKAKLAGALAPPAPAPSP